jgi:radical SAM-linked protein
MSMSKTRLRIRFTKCGDLKWISHRDLARLWERLLRRAGLELAFSEGFHPKPRISFPSALALGIEALDEIVELEIVGEFSLEEIEASIRRELPAGMELIEICPLLAGIGKARVVGASYRVKLPQAVRERAAAQIEVLNRQASLEVEREGKLVACLRNDPHFELRLENDDLHFTLPNSAAGSLRPLEMLTLLQLPDLLSDGANLQRTRVHLSEKSTVPETEPSNPA